MKEKIKKLVDLLAEKPVENWRKHTVYTSRIIKIDNIRYTVESSRLTIINMNSEQTEIFEDSCVNDLYEELRNDQLEKWNIKKEKFLDDILTKIK